jgi:colanic acid biosynthesis glycosyl transferase WcaI
VRILVLNEYFRPDQAASAQRITDLAEDLAHDHEVIAIAGRPSYNLLAHAAAVDGVAPRTVEVRHVPSTSFARYRPWRRAANYLTYLSGALVSGLWVDRPDLVIAATDPPLIGGVGWLISRVRRVPFVHIVWDVQPDVALAAGLIRDGWLTRTLASLNRVALTRATCVIAPTAEIARSVVQLGVRADRVHTIPHWEDLDVVQVRPKRNGFSEAHGLADRFVVMYAGNHGLTQELGRCLELATRLRDLDDFVLVFVGDGAAKRGLRERTAALGLTNVRFFPYESRQTMQDSLATADVLLAPLAAGLTRFMLPSKIYTILASGRPVVAMLDAESELRELVARGACGFVEAPGDLDAVEARLRWLHAHPEARAEMGRRARATAETHYARTVVTPQFAALVRGLERVPVGALSPVP